MTADTKTALTDAKATPHELVLSGKTCEFVSFFFFFFFPASFECVAQAL